MAILRFIIGACLGSFFCLVAQRIPQGQSILRPRSHCPICKTFLSWHELIPLLSFLWQKRRCRHCQNELGFSYFTAELCCGMLFLTYPSLPNLHGFLWLLLSFVLALVDWYYFILEPKLFYFGTVLLSGIYLYQKGFIYWETSLYCLIISLFCWLFLKEALGLGDLLLLLAWSFWLPLRQFAALLMIACLSGLFAFLLIALLKPRQKELPFIPFLTLGLWVILLLN
ncbi:A24 family peptidase [Enterococcus sp. 2201sp1_2201st1_B8_2201SCRN_220225]|uniref:prepilin peptidase n=1 Tax=unclassified Enterococcus TaxID=2608891 RepID=UPI0034A40914